MAMIYALRKNGMFLAAGTAEELAETINVTTQDIRKMANPEWHERFPKMPYTEFIAVRLRENEPWRACKENDVGVYRMVKFGMSFHDIADYLGISVIMAENAYNRAANGRYGPCELF